MALPEQFLLEQFLLGIYLGVVTGILPGVVAWSLAFVFKYFTKVTIPALGVMVVAVGLAGVQGGLLGLLDVQGVTAIVALLVVMMISMYCHSQGDKMGAEFPHRVSLKSLKERTLPADVVEKVGKFGRVRIRVVGEVIEMEGYAPLSEETKRHIKDGEWTFPADLSVSELENRMAERLIEEFELSDVSVSIDGNGNATVVAAPSVSGLSKRVPSGKRAVSFDTLVPTGLARGDEVKIELEGSTVKGTVVSAKSGGKTEKGDDGTKTESAGAKTETDGGVGDITDEKTEGQPLAPSTTGGEGRVTVAVDKTTANAILEGEPKKIVVTSRGTRREYELISVLKSAGKQFRKVNVSSVGEDETLGSFEVRDSFGVIVLAVRRGQTRIIAPRGNEPVKTGDDLFVVGGRSEIDSFEEGLR
jgi:hypothetical protein